MYVIPYETVCVKAYVTDSAYGLVYVMEYGSQCDSEYDLAYEMD